jgi:hypothetical protein
MCKEAHVEERLFRFGETSDAAADSKPHRKRGQQRADDIVH